jgi:hypothetical protein
MAHELEVWPSADRVGTLALVEGRLTFWYAADWLARPDAVRCPVHCRCRPVGIAGIGEESDVPRHLN